MGLALALSLVSCSNSSSKSADAGAAGSGRADTGSAGAAARAGAGGAIPDAGRPAVDGGRSTGIFGITGPGCKRYGCSGHNCGEASLSDLITNCGPKPDDACYQNARCEHQANGNCAFTPSSDFSDCLAHAATDGGSSLSWYETCGAAVCTGGVMNDPNVPDCTTERAGEPCTTRDVQCDLLNHCGTKLQCTDHDPTAGGCPSG
jgi:hypothetical protein